MSFIPVALPTFRTARADHPHEVRTMLARLPDRPLRPVDYWRVVDNLVPPAETVAYCSRTSR
ncbi:hypothetical protein GCM10010302_21980 [Streptomyces polychromogenes]|uniref:Uncharacterized protein n=1 Tax=Streptomyces polychromogenes TaxID=67342 RepID=A0ABN0VAJ8_9ACTN